MTFHHVKSHEDKRLLSWPSVTSEQTPPHDPPRTEDQRCKLDFYFPVSFWSLWGLRGFFTVLQWSSGLEAKHHCAKNKIEPCVCVRARADGSFLAKTLILWGPVALILKNIIFILHFGVMGKVWFWISLARLRRWFWVWQLRIKSVQLLHWPLRCLKYPTVVL